MNEETKCCKWCEFCVNTDLEHGYGHCNLDIGEQVKDTVNECCSAYKFNGSLNRT